MLSVAPIADGRSSPAGFSLRLSRFRTAIAALLSCLLVPAFAQTPTPLATGLSVNADVVPPLYFDGGYLYFGELSGSLGTLVRVPDTGGAKTILATGTSILDSGNWAGIFRIDSSATNLYFSYGGYGITRIEEMARDQSTRRVMADFSGGAFLGLFGTDVHYLSGFSRMYRLGVAPGSTPVLVADGIWPRGEVKDGDTLFFVDHYSKSLYRYRPSTDAAPVPIMTGNATVGGTHLNSVSAFVAFPGYIKQVSRSGGPVTTIALAPDGRALAVDDQYAYYTLPSSSHSYGLVGLWRRPLNGSSADELIDGGAVVAGGVAYARNGFIYWFDIRNGASNGTLYRLAANNQPPTANAGIDQSIRAGQVVNLNGGASYDDNTPTASLTYAWTITSKPLGSVATLTNANTMTPSFTADKGGTYQINLVVTDSAGLASQPDQVVVSSLNQAPTADAGSPQLVVVNTLVQLNGNGSVDPDGDAMSYSWLINTAPEGSTAALTGATTATPFFTPDIAGTYAVTLQLTDAYGGASEASVEITAATLTSYVEQKLAASASVIAGLSEDEVSTVGNQMALVSLLTQAVQGSQAGNTSAAVAKINLAIERTNGCETSGVPDGNGPGRDWITDCAVQASALASLRQALTALSP